MPSTKQQGDEFERSVAEILEVSGYSVKRETLVGHKKIDLYFEEYRFSSTRRVAVECKDYSAPLTKDVVVRIYADYAPLVQANLIDEVLLVTRRGLAPSVDAFVAEARILLHCTYDTLVSNVMDFKQYLEHLITTYETDPTSRYYVGLNSTHGQDLAQAVYRWLAESEQPLAILGSYGSGKTTFASHLCWSLAREVLDSNIARIPILLRLGDISSEQSLEGLLGKALTANSVVPRYSFPTFMMLNRAGRFVILLDGFDEMKQTLSWETFRFNFAQLNRLVVPGSRVILLGRPTAFLNDEEYRFALHGRRSFAGQEIRDAEWPDYIEMHVASFSRKQVEEFLLLYFQYRLNVLLMYSRKTFSQRFVLNLQERIFPLQLVVTTKLHALESRDKPQRMPDSLVTGSEVVLFEDEINVQIWRIESIIRSDFEAITSKHLIDIARRPVQLRMLTEVLPQWNRDVSELTTAILYSEFIDLIIDRELKKDSRLRFGKTTRRDFARSLAWWLWTIRSNDRQITADALPIELFEPFCSTAEELPSVRRDLVAACFLERKLGGTLHFPHRSFQEFLVAEEIAERLDRQQIGFREVDTMLTEEIADFLAGIVGLKNLKLWDEQLVNYRGLMTRRFLRIWISEAAYAEHILNRFRSTSCPWYALILTIGVNGKKFKNISAQGLSGELLDRVHNAKEEVRNYSLVDPVRLPTVLYSLVAHLCVTSLAEHVGSLEHVMQSFLTLFSMEGYDLSDGERPKRIYRPDPICVELARKVNVNRKKMILELGAVYPWLGANLRAYCMIADWLIGDTIKTDDVVLPWKVSVRSSSHWSALDETLRRVRALGDVVDPSILE